MAPGKGHSWIRKIGFKRIANLLLNLSGIALKTLAKRSDILKEKYFFFINRVLTYFSFLLIPIFINEISYLSNASQSVIILFYMLFMGGQWYLLGKEVDHRFNIYYKADSSIERVLYRFIVGSVLTIFLYSVFAIFPFKLTQALFWAFYLIVGLFYSWPTRGKIIEESMTGQFGEYRFLDSFERTVLFVSVIMFLVSVPEISFFQNIEALKLYLDPKETIHYFVWDFLSVNYIPFASNPKLFNLAWNFHIYFLGIGYFLLAFYVLCRFFFSRRLAILGVFSVISTWSFSLILEENPVQSFTTTYILVWAWSIIWSIKSDTYRSGLFVGLVLALGTLINIHYIHLVPITLASVYFYFLSEKTLWYRRQWLKYNLLGVVLSIITISSHFELGKILSGVGFLETFKILKIYVGRKAFFFLSILSVLLLALSSLGRSKKYFNLLNFDFRHFKDLLLLASVAFILGIVINPLYVKGFSIIWFIAFLSLIPLEWIFQSISRLRSKRNIIYTLYILVCLLDSHFEVRIRNMIKTFFDDSLSKYINQL